MDFNEALVRDSEHDPEEMAEPIFDPKAFNEQFGPLECDAYRLSEQESLTYAELATSIREHYAQQALDFDSQR